MYVMLKVQMPHTKVSNIEEKFSFYRIVFPEFTKSSHIMLNNSHPHSTVLTLIKPIYITDHSYDLLKLVPVVQSHLINETIILFQSGSDFFLCSSL